MSTLSVLIIFQGGVRTNPLPRIPPPLATVMMLDVLDGSLTFRKIQSVRNYEIEEKITCIQWYTAYI